MARKSIRSKGGNGNPKKTVPRPKNPKVQKRAPQDKGGK